MMHFGSSAHGALSDERLPVSGVLFARLCRSTPSEAREMSLALPSNDRARLALFCNARAHLREVGREIASVCSETSLVVEGGHAGKVLFGQVKAGPETFEIHARVPTKRISLSHAR